MALLDKALRSADPADGRATADPGAAAVLAEACGFLPLALRVLADVVARNRNEPLGAPMSGTGVAAAFAASYDRLPEAQARLARLVSRHAGGTVTASAAAALSGAEPAATRNLLDRLRRANLLRAGAAADEYRWHDLLREHAVELGERVDDEETRATADRSLVRHYVEHLDAVRAHLGSTGSELFADRIAALAWFDAEADNLLPVLTSAARRGLHVEVRDAGEAAFPCFAACRPGEWGPIADLALASARASGDRSAEGRLLDALGRHHLERPERALPHLEAALELCREAGSARDVGDCLEGLGLAHAGAGRPEAAERRFVDALAAYREAGDRVAEADVLGRLGSLRGAAGRFAEALADHQRESVLRGEERDGRGQAVAELHVGLAHRALGSSEEALAHLRPAVGRLAAFGEQELSERAAAAIAEVERTSRRWFRGRRRGR